MQVWRLIDILAAMTLAEAMETTRLNRVAGLTGARTVFVPVRARVGPHKTISAVALIGGS
jgi:predicted ATPase with chaperone activity